MVTEPLPIFDPRRNFQTQGFTGRGATTTIHDASATGVSVSGIFQAAEDFAVLGFYNAYDYFNHLRQKHLPRTDLSGLMLEFDIEYDHALDGAMRLDAAKYPSVSWDSMTFVCGKGGAWRDPRGEAPLVRHGGVRRRDARQCERRGVGHAGRVGRRPHRRDVPRHGLRLHPVGQALQLPQVALLAQRHHRPVARPISTR